MESDRRQQSAQVLLLSGFLGAGKTTLLRRILSWQTDLSDTVVIVNEFGEVGVDGDLLRDAGSDVIELTSGCICCTISADLKQSLSKIRQRFQPSRIIIESSGVADPTAVASVIKMPELSAHMHLSKIITVLEADIWEGREVFGPLFFNQLGMAHLILLNKVDLLANEKIRQFLGELHELLPGSQVVPTIRCAVDPETLWAPAAVKTFGLKPISFYRPVSHGSENEPMHSHGGDAHASVDASNYVTFSFRGFQVFNETCFRKFIKDLPWEVFRVKGPVRFADRMIMLNFVGGKAEWLPWEGEPETRLAFIGWDTRKEDILNKLERCIVKTPDSALRGRLDESSSEASAGA